MPLVASGTKKSRLLSSHNERVSSIQVYFGEESSEGCFVVHDADKVVFIVAVFSIFLDVIKLVRVGDLLAKRQPVE